jgi:hypothetical protein
LRAMELDFDISARNWFLNYILSSGYTLQGMKELSDSRVEALYVLIEDGVSYVVRTIAEINGPRMVLASYYLPDSRWEEERALQEKVVHSFKFLKPETIKIEKARTYSFLDMLRFDYPISWKLLAPNIYSIEGMEARLVNTLDNDTLNGEIEIHIVSTELDTTLAQEVQYLKEDLRATGLGIGDLIEVRDDYNFKEHIFFSRVEVYRATDRKERVVGHEYWLAILVEDRYYYIVTMLTPDRTSDFYTWARNMESFQTVIESIRP